MSDDELNQLAERALLHDDGEALGLLWLQLEGLLRATAARCATLGLSQPDDIVQSAFYRVFRNRERAQSIYAQQGLGGLRGYLMKAVENRVIESARKPAVNRRLPMESDPAVSEVEAIEARILQQEHDAAFWARVFSATNEQDADLVRMRYQEDLGFTEIAAKMDMKEASVRKRLHRLLCRLRGVLEDSDEGL